MTVQVGVGVFPEPGFLRRAAAAAEAADFLEIAPETLWDAGRAAGARHASMLHLVRRSGRGVVGHGVGLSLGGVGDDARFERHLAAVARDHAAFGFAWYSDHLGFVGHGGSFAALPLPLPPTDEAVAAVARRLRRVAEVVPLVAVENTAQTFLLGGPRDEARFLGRILTAADCGLVLDLHNVAVTCANVGASAEEYVAALDLSRVIEIHVSGGSASEPAWLASGRSFRLDSHDGAVPEDVWRLLERTVPACPNLRGVTVEWVAEGLGPDDGPRLAAEVARARSVAC
jgi:uncharacterized protein